MRLKHLSSYAPSPSIHEKRKTRRGVLTRRAASFLFDPVLVTSWSPSHRGFFQLYHCWNRLRGGCQVCLRVEHCPAGGAGGFPLFSQLPCAEWCEHEPYSF